MASWREMSLPMLMEELRATEVGLRYGASEAMPGRAGFALRCFECEKAPGYAARRRHSGAAITGEQSSVDSFERMRKSAISRRGNN